MYRDAQFVKAAQFAGPEVFTVKLLTGFHFDFSDGRQLGPGVTIVTSVDFNRNKGFIERAESCQEMSVGFISCLTRCFWVEAIAPTEREVFGLTISTGSGDSVFESSPAVNMGFASGSVIPSSLARRNSLYGSVCSPLRSM